ncbi:MAG: hypothetical protein KC443_25100, partial [Anaerolineales bacterium]|nr:hypothetical protein [Anaerolineales bacterium]
LGLYYYQARFYVPGIGRFASADTVVLNPANPQSYNRYSYVLNNAVRFTDPTGHVCYDPGMDAAMLGNCNGGSIPSPTLPSASAAALGIEFSAGWSNNDQQVVVNVAIQIDVALWRAGNFQGRYVAGATFKAVYGGVKFNYSSVQEYHNGKAIGARTNSAHEITFYDAAFSVLPLSFKYNIAHELGHAFNANALSADPTPANPNRRTGQPYRDLQNEGISVDNVLIAGGNPYLRTNKGYQLASGNKPYPYQQDTAPSPGEDFADMFSNWAFNSFAANAYGAERYAWMNSHMPEWTTLAVSVNQ